MNKIVYVILFTMFAFSPLYSQNSQVTVIGFGTELRENPNLNSKIIEFLNKGARLSILNSKSKTIFIGKYLGKWIKVSTQDGKKGFVFDAYISYSPGEEKFHIFFESFFNKVYKNYNDTLVRKYKNFKFKQCDPLIDGNQKGNCSIIYIKNITNRDIIASDGSRNKNYFPTHFQIKENKIIVEIDLGGSHLYEWHFKQIKNKWYIVYVLSVSC